ncbi:hypothetical protein DFJ73DRAFT_758239 [Zopfochytrium polystomum]|nr:hypothetical protein DFJ73DRAFT_758239 [Zopfochytrium polystomum]
MIDWFALPDSEGAAAHDVDAGSPVFVIQHDCNPEPINQSSINYSVIVIIKPSSALFAVGDATRAANDDRAIFQFANVAGNGTFTVGLPVLGSDSCCGAGQSTSAIQWRRCRRGPTRGWTNLVVIHAQVEEDSEVVELSDEPGLAFVLPGVRRVQEAWWWTIGLNRQTYALHRALAEEELNVTVYTVYEDSRAMRCPATSVAFGASLAEPWCLNKGKCSPPIAAKCMDGIKGPSNSGQSPTGQENQRVHVCRVGRLEKGTAWAIPRARCSRWLINGNGVAFKLS